MAERREAVRGARRGQIPDEPTLRLDRGPTGERYSTYIDTCGDFQRVEWLDATEGDAAVWDLLLHLFRDEGIDPTFAVLFTTATLPGSLYYAPLANDVEGIGDGLFDTTPGRRLEGYIFMNDVPYWQEHPAEMEMLFNQELGHRFGVFVQGDLGDGPTDLLLGRARQHWSYFLHTDSSPMEGNAWVDHGDGTFTTATVPNALAYHSLDLYLMGLIPPEEAEPTFLIRNATDAGFDCLGFPVYSGSVPQFCEPPKTVQGERVDVDVGQIIAVEGPRRPAWPDTPDRFEVAFVLLALTEGDAQNLTMLRGFDELLRRAVAAFHTGTGGRAELAVVTGTPGGLDALHPDTLQDEAGCACRAGHRGGSAGPSWAATLAALLAMRSRRS